MTKNEAKLLRDRLYSTAKARGTAPPSPMIALGEIQANGGVQFAPTSWGFPDGSVLRCVLGRGTQFHWTAFECNPFPSLRHTTTAHK